MLALADRGLFSIELWRQAKASGAHLLWRVRTGQGSPALPMDRMLADGSWHSRLGVVSDRSHQRRRQPIVVRVVDYTIDDPGAGWPAAPLPAGDLDA